MLIHLDLALGLLALLAGFGAVVSAILATRHERAARARLPLHSVRIEVDGLSVTQLSVRSGASSPDSLAAHIKQAIDNYAF